MKLKQCSERLSLTNNGWLRSPISLHMKIFDCFSFFNELDLLELRLNILNPYVDYFVLAEAEETFTGKPKSLYYKENYERFAKWDHKILHLINENLDTGDPFTRAGYQKDRLREVLNVHAKDEDIVYFGDLDEIWKPQNVTDDKVYNLTQFNYSYWLNNRSSEEWVGTIVGKWGTIKTNTLNHWRATHTNVLPDGGWHFTNMGGEEQIIKKIEAYDHANEVIPRLSQFEGYGIKDRMEKGYDYLGRQFDYWGKPFEFHMEEENWPEYLKDNKEKYQHLCK